MTAAEMMRRACSGDVILVKGQGVIGTLIRGLTGESYSHVALLLRDPGGVGWQVAEFGEGIGFSLMPLVEWLDKRRGQTLFYGVAPEVVRQKPGTVHLAATRYVSAGWIRGTYGYLSLAKVWLSQVLKINIPVLQKVCSTFAQEVWKLAGYTGFTRTADPGDIAEHCTVRYPLWSDR